MRRFSGRWWRAALRRQCVPGVVIGVVSGLMLYAAWLLAPPGLAEASQRLSLPLGTRLLYGGITEEVLLRWGLMTGLLWLAWRFVQGRRGTPDMRSVALAIAISALMFGVGHLPAAVALVGALDASGVVWVVGVNGTFGALFGFLFWRSGLEAAMIAHALAHAVHALTDFLL